MYVDFESALCVNGSTAIYTTLNNSAMYQENVTNLRAQNIIQL